MRVRHLYPKSKVMVKHHTDVLARIVHVVLYARWLVQIHMKFR